MKAISLWQPWASAMALGFKAIETRHWYTGYRGLMAIHAAKRWTGEEREMSADFARELETPALASPPLGAIVATGRLVEVRRTDDLVIRISPTERMLGNYGGGRFGWIFADIVALAEPIPCTGAQGLFDVPDDLSTLTIGRRAAVQQSRPQGDLFGSPGGIS